MKNLVKELRGKWMGFLSRIFINFRSWCGSVGEVLDLWGSGGEGDSIIIGELFYYIGY